MSALSADGFGDFGFRVWGLEGLGFRASGLGVYDAGMMDGLGLRVQCLGFRVYRFSASNA